VTASETEFHIALSQQTFTPGRYTFEAINAGTTIHNLAITGPGLTGAITKDLGPGDKADLTVTLQKGSYDVFCAIDAHKSLGMDVHITVS
jgi:plastocyanin